MNKWHEMEDEVESELPEFGQIVIGYNKKWVDEDFNPEGMRECFITDTGEGIEWNSAKWADCHEEWIVDRKTTPTHWQSRPEPPK